MDIKDKLISNILDIEVNMFLTVTTKQKSSCQNYPESFKIHRRAQFIPWSAETLESYLNDLRAAEKNNINLMKFKYARMDNLIPTVNDNPLIKKITGILLDWQEVFFENYPNIAMKARPVSSSGNTMNTTSFETYLSGELETYSNKTLELLYKDVMGKKSRGINMSEEIYTYLVTSLGYESLQDVEEKNGLVK